MKIILKQTDFKHLTELSKYNNNFYEHKELKYIVFELCHEDYNYYSFFLMEMGLKIFIGDSMDGFSLPIDKDEIEIDFKKPHT